MPVPAARNRVLRQTIAAAAVRAAPSPSPVKTLAAAPTDCFRPVAVHRNTKPSTAAAAGGGRIAIITRSDRFTGEQPGTYTAYAGSANGRISVLGAAVGYLPGTNGTFHVWRPRGTVLLVH